MKKFSELGISGDDGRKLFRCNQVSITDIVNCEIEVVDFIAGMTTKHGEGRTLIHFRHNGTDGKFFSNCGNIKRALDTAKKEDFPFSTTIKCTNCGKSKIFQFT